MYSWKLYFTTCHIMCLIYAITRSLIKNGINLALQSIMTLTHTIQIREYVHSFMRWILVISHRNINVTLSPVWSCYLKVCGDEGDRIILYYFFQKCCHSHTKWTLLIRTFWRTIPKTSVVVVLIERHASRMFPCHIKETGDARLFEPYDISMTTHDASGPWLEWSALE